MTERDELVEELYVSADEFMCCQDRRKRDPIEAAESAVEKMLDPTDGYVEQWGDGTGRAELCVSQALHALARGDDAAYISGSTEPDVKAAIHGLATRLVDEAMNATSGWYANEKPTWALEFKRVRVRSTIKVAPGTGPSSLIGTRWLIERASTLSEAETLLREAADALKELEREGWQLSEPVSDNYGSVVKETTC